MFRTFLGVTFALFFTFSAHASWTCQDILYKQSDLIDFGSQWGTLFFPLSDPTWKDPKYLSLLYHLAAPSLTNFGYNNKALKLLEEWSDLMNSLGADGTPIEFTTSGTAANNLLFDIAQEHLEEKIDKNSPEQDSYPRANILSLDTQYGGVHGRVDGELTEPTLEDLPSARIHPNKILSDTEVQELEEIENEIIEAYRQYIKEPSNHVAALFLEVVGFNKDRQLSVYRKEFLIKLRQLADELDVLIFVDEILSGGGRTGKFWAYQHFEGFVPDYLTFGKGLILKGVFRPNEAKSYGAYQRTYNTTTAENPLAVAQALQVLQTMQQRNSIKQIPALEKYFREKATKYFEYFLAKGFLGSNISPSFIDFLRREYRENGIRSFGFMLDLPVGALSDSVIPGFHNRGLPPLSMSKEQIDKLFEVPE